MKKNGMKGPVQNNIIRGNITAINSINYHSIKSTKNKPLIYLLPPSHHKGTVNNNSIGNQS